MRTHDGRINHLQCRVGQAAAGERLQHHIPDATVSPAAELPKNRIPVAELLRQIAPRRAGPHQPKRRVHHTAMVARRTASATDQKRFEIRPLIIGQQSANQGCPPQRAALNQFSIPASIDLSTRPSPVNLGSRHASVIEGRDLLATKAIHITEIRLRIARGHSNHPTMKQILLMHMVAFRLVDLLPHCRRWFASVFILELCRGERRRIVSWWRHGQG
jgi:hypothetical protein